MYEHALDTDTPIPILDHMVNIARTGEVIELLRNGTTEAVIIGIDLYDELVANTERLDTARAFITKVAEAHA